MKKIFLILSLLLLTTACSQEPTVTDSIYSKEIPKGFTAVSVCYSASDSTRDEIMAVALAKCPETANAVEPWNKDMVINACPVLKKERITFLCVIK